MWMNMLMLSVALLIARPDTRMEDRQAILQAIADANESYARHGVPGEQIWSETSPPHLEAPSIRFVSSTSALVDAVETQIGGISLKRTSDVVLELKKEGGEWRVADR